MCGGGGGGQRGLEQEEKDLLRMQAQVAGQGIRGREEAMGGFRDLRARGRERASIASQNQEAGRVMEDAYAGYGNAQRMREAQMASMGVRGNPDNMFRGRDDAGVGMAAQAASGASAARRNVRQEGLGLETAGLAGLGGFDPSGALNSMSNTIGNAQRTNAASDAATAQGWGQLGQAGMYGLSNADKIEKGFKTMSGWFGGGGPEQLADGGLVPSYAEGGEVMGMRRYANGGNVYDQAMQDVGQYRPPAAQPAPAPQPGVNPATAMRVAKMAVDKAASSSLGYGAATPGVSMGSQQAAMLADQTAAFGAEGLASTAAAAEGATAAGALGAEAAGAGLASGAAGASAALGTAIPVLGLGMLAAGLLSRKDGGSVPRTASRPGIGRKQVAGRAQNSKGGKVTGPGGPKDDMVMARLSPGEYVLPVGAVKKYGLDRLEKMRQEGLEFERQRNIA